MTELMKSEVFFFISSIGFVLIALLIIILIAYLIKAVKSFNKLVDKLDNEIDTLGDTAKDLVDDIRHSFIYKMVFNPRSRRTILSNKLHKQDGK